MLYIMITQNITTLDVVNIYILNIDIKYLRISLPKNYYKIVEQNCRFDLNSVSSHVFLPKYSWEKINCSSGFI
jgi:hypothetical protein